MTSTLTIPPALAGITLGVGGHARPEQEPNCLCFMEAAAKLAGLPNTMHPATVDKTITYMGIGINDTLDDTARQALLPLIPKVLDTAEDGLADQRLAYAMKWAIAELAPELLIRIGLEEYADALAFYVHRLPVELGRASRKWGEPLGALSHARIATYLYPRTHELSADEDQRFEDVHAVLSRILTALVDYNDTGAYLTDTRSNEAIANELGHIFHVSINYDFTPIFPLLSRFFGELIFTGRSYL